MTRKAHTQTIATLLAWCTIALASTLAQAQPASQMVSVKGSILNMRSGPGTQNTILWELQKGYPLQVTQRKNRWLKVKDFEGDSGWVAASLTGRTPHHIVKVNNANVRSGPGTQHRIVSKATYGELMRTREKRDGWVRVERNEGKSGWISKKLLWGW
ncbi:SH3 domain-containing protein [Hydrogenophaga sp.]|uniref:SH3 domain-containing protein n=1 Tax=Hydrogenophaga sp. TaxID=1904254 RepID=UPI002604717C|nr:SH3 domain-containing protein [Hydrogenophaga sp.]MDM7949902.1 SH3 domain-containing protein [Hydrogenophaga sp.]